MNKESKWIFSYPRKTFLIGEYAVLHGAPAVLLNTKPCFQFHVDPKPSSESIPFHPESSAALFVEKNKDVFSGISIHGEPHQASGFGLSGAEFNCVYDIFLKKKNLKLSVSKLWNIYKSLSQGSGADVISQRTKGVCLFHPKPFQARSVKWPFSDLGFAIIRLMKEYNTYEHLDNLNLKAFPLLTKWSIQAEQAFLNNREDMLIESLIEYSDVLVHLNLVAEDTYQLTQKLNKNSTILCAKGCGAMGAETMIVLFKKEKEQEVLETLKPLKVEATLSSIDNPSSIETNS